MERGLSEKSAGYLEKWKLGARNTYRGNTSIKNHSYHLYNYSFIHSFIHQRLYSLLLGPGLFFSFVIFFTQTVGLLGRGISPSQGHYLHTGQHKHRINSHTDTHSSSGIRTQDPSIRASEDSSCLRERGHCDKRI
jgi:hypothetical protein